MTIAQTVLVRSLDSKQDVAEVGRKAARLAELRQAGFPVPPGLVLTVAAFESGEFTEEVLGALRRIVTEFGDVPLAVRSSGVAEDGGERSYAGQYETVLGVVGFHGLVAAVRTCWDSAVAAHLQAYQGNADRPGLAVLVQPMVPALAAGVAFSANPVTGARDEVRVDVVRGLGDKLVSGQAEPDSWMVRAEPSRLSGAQDALDASQVAAVAALARRVAEEAGEPQDIEWAWADDLVLLQARPITALPDPGPVPVPVEFEVPPGFWLRGGYTLKPLSPMNTSTLIRSVNEMSANLFRYAFGERVAVLDLGGWSYVRIVPLSSMDEMRARARLIVAAGRADEPGEIVSNWYSEWLPGLLAQLESVRSMVLPELSDLALSAELIRRVELAYEAQRLHFLVGGVSSMVWGELGVLCRDLLGWGVPEILPLLTGLPGKASEPAQELARLARLAADDPSVLEKPFGAFAAAFEWYLVEYGQRCLGADIAEPSLSEQPQLVLSLIADQLSAGTDPAAALAETVAEREKASRGSTGCSSARARRFPCETTPGSRPTSAGVRSGMRSRRWPHAWSPGGSWTPSRRSSCSPWAKRSRRSTPARTCTGWWHCEPVSRSGPGPISGRRPTVSGSPDRPKRTLWPSWIRTIARCSSRCCGSTRCPTWARKPRRRPGTGCCMGRRRRRAGTPAPSGW